MKRIVTTIIAASLAVTSFGTAPAFAGKKEDDLVRFLAGAAVIYMIAKQAEAQQNRGQVQRRYAPVQRRAPARLHRRVLPARCRVDYQNNHGRWRVGYLRRCTQNNTFRPGRLPQACIRDAWTARGHRLVYNRHCMRQRGWQA